MKLKFYDTLKIIFLSVLITYSIKCSQTESNEKINISEGFMKHKKTGKSSVNLLKNNFANTNLLQKKERITMKKSRTNNSPNLASAGQATNSNTNQVSGSPDVQTFDQNSNLLKSTNLGETAEKLANEDIAKDSSVIDLNIGSGPVYTTGWIKYFKYTQTSETKRLSIDRTPRTFIPNGKYFEQYKLFPGFDKSNATSSDGTSTLSTHIPDERSFYAILLKDSLNILTSRQVNIFSIFIYFINCLFYSDNYHLYSKRIFQSENIYN